jgi:hypothetical protein
MFCPSCGKEIPDQSAFCMGCGKSIPSGQTAAASRSSAPSARSIGKIVTYLVILGLVGIAVVLAVASRKNNSEPQKDAAAEIAHMPVFRPKKEKLFSGQIVVRAGQMVWQKIQVDTEAMHDVRVMGKFRASGGSGNDVQAVLADEDSFENWKNGHQAQVLYSTGQVTVGELNTPITKSGTYYFCLSNKFSMFTSKDVFAEIDLVYRQKEP